MHRRAFVAALGGVFAVTVAKAQTPVDPLIGGVLGIPGAALGAGADVLGGSANVLGGGLLGGGPLVGAGDGFRLADLMGGEFAIETSKLALERSRSRAVRDFAQLEINEQVSVAAALGAAPGSVAPRPDQQAVVRRLASMRSGPGFDRAYILGQIKGHNELLSVNSQAIQSDPNPAVRRVATLSVPTIQTHLAILYRLRAGVSAV